MPETPQELWGRCNLRKVLPYFSLLVRGRIAKCPRWTARNGVLIINKKESSFDNRLKKKIANLKILFPAHKLLFL